MVFFYLIVFIANLLANLLATRCNRAAAEAQSNQKVCN